MAIDHEPLTAPPSRRPGNRELYIDAFRGLMALVMVQGHVCDALLTPAARAEPWYVFQTMFHGTTAPGFLFASGFVAGLPRAPLSLRASLRRACRLLFVLGVGYFLHLPYFSLGKTLAAASPAEKAALFACDALQVIAVTQLLVIALQWLAGPRWPLAGATLGVLILVLGPFVWASGLSASLPAPLGAYLDQRSGSIFPVFPFSAFVLAGTLAGSTLGRQEPAVRYRRALLAGLVLLGLGAGLTPLLEGRVGFWGVSPAYVLIRLGGLLLLLLLVEAASWRPLPGVAALSLLGHETLLVYVLHLVLLFGGIFGPGLLAPWQGRLSFAGAFATVALMIPVLLAAAGAWRAFKARRPHEAWLVLVFLTAAVVCEFLTSPW
jgi:fucose 4-O-acetylase-like acetyltransferase